MRLKPGKYYIGDPAYVVEDDDHLDQIINNQFDLAPCAAVHVKENKSYFSSTGLQIDVDSNCICCLSVEYLAEHEPEALKIESKNIVLFQNWFEVEKLANIIQIDDIEIET
jgi:hypothetical protein